MQPTKMLHSVVCERTVKVPMPRLRMHAVAKAANLPPLIEAQTISIVGVCIGAAALALAGATLKRLKRAERRVKRAEAIAKSAIAQSAFLRALHAERADSAGRGGTAPAFRAQFGEDLFLHELFKGQASGYYIEVGAYDGVTFSVSHVFEQLGWTGLLIEATPRRAEECRVNRPRSRVVHAALGPPGAPATATFRVGINRARAGETSGSDMLSHLDAAAGHDWRSESSRRFESVTVPLTTMSALLDQQPPANGAIDFASIDVEGGEWGLLQGLDLKRHRPRVMLVEQGAGPDDPDAVRIREHLTSNGYRAIGTFMGSAAYGRSDESALCARAEHLLGLLAHR